MPSKRPLTEVPSDANDDTLTAATAGAGTLGEGEPEGVLDVVTEVVVVVEGVSEGVIDCEAEGRADADRPTNNECDMDMEAVASGEVLLDFDVDSDALAVGVPALDGVLLLVDVLSVWVMVAENEGEAVGDGEGMGEAANVTDKVSLQLPVLVPVGDAGTVTEYDEEPVGEGEGGADGVVEALQDSVEEAVPEVVAVAD